jgi:hypothetical protein
MKKNTIYYKYNNTTGVGLHGSIELLEFLARWRDVGGRLRQFWGGLEAHHWEKRLDSRRRAYVQRLHHH